MKYLFVVLVLLPCVLSERQGKFLSLFQVVQFSNGECNGTDTSKQGVCYTSAQCTAAGGTDIGKCASDYGVCCQVLKACESDGANDKLNNTVWTEEDFEGEANAVQRCKYTVTADDNIELVRLDFEEFVFAQPNAATGVCEDDIVSIGGNKLCGEVTEDYPQHLYVPLESGKLTLMITAKNALANRKFKIKVSLIENDNANKPPTGCDKYYFGESTGTISSFNFADATTSTRQIANQDVKTCIATEDDMCSIKYEECDGVTNSFSLSGDATAAKVGNANLGPPAGRRRRRRSMNSFFAAISRQARAVTDTCTFADMATTCGGVGEACEDTANPGTACTALIADCTCNCDTTNNFENVNGVCVTSTNFATCTDVTDPAPVYPAGPCTGVGQVCTGGPPGTCTCDAPTYLATGTQCAIDVSQLPYTPGTCGMDTAAMDYVGIECPTNAVNPTEAPDMCFGSKFCGTVFNSDTILDSVNDQPEALTTFTTPFTVTYHTDDTEQSAATPPEQGNAGYCLKFSQELCA